MGKTFFDNTVMKKLKNHEPVCGCWSHGSSHVNAEIMAEAGFDLMIIDMEHSQLSLQDTVHIIQTTKGTGCAPFVRTPWNDMVWIKQALDTGAYGIHVPYVSTRKEAEYAVNAANMRRRVSVESQAAREPQTSVFQRLIIMPERMRM